MLTAYYDLSVCPPTYDIVAFLSAVEAERRSRNDDHVRIVVLPGPVNGFRRDRFWPHDVAGRRAMLENVALPMARMLPGATVEVSERRPDRPEAGSIGFGKPLYGLAQHVRALRSGIRPLRPQNEFPRFPKFVTITLREAEHWPERNSNALAWYEAARRIDGMGYKVVVVRDTLRAREPVAGLTTNQIASHDLEYRASLYRAAYCNFFVNNGPAWFALALDAAALILKPTTEGLNRTCSASFFRQCGIQPGGQIPGCPRWQQLVWSEDTTSAILDAFEAYASVPMRQAS